MKRRILTFLLLLAGSYAMAQSAWVVDKAHSEIQFTVTHLVITEVSGEFDEFDAKVTSSGDDFTGADVEFVAKVASINTNNEQRDKHLKSDDFFNAELYPEMKFEGQLMKENGKYVLKGNMTIRDVTREVTFDAAYNGTVTDPWGNTKSGFKVQGKINRFDYGLKWNNLMESGGAVVGEEVDIVCNVQLQKQA